MYEDGLGDDTKYIEPLSLDKILLDTGSCKQADNQSHSTIEVQRSSTIHFDLADHETKIN